MNYIKDLVSVIVPTYNRANMLPRAIESIQKQTYKNIEIIVIANGCNDNTEEVINSLQEQYNNIVFLNFKESLGGAEARNKGLDIAKGEFIAFLDDDDEWLENKLEKQLEILKNSDYCIVGCNYLKVSKKRTLKLKSSKNIINFDDMLYGNLLGSYSFCITRQEDIKDLRINKNLNANQDWDLWLKILLYTNKKAYILKDILVKYYDHDIKISTNFGRKIKAEYIFVDYWKQYYSSNILEFHLMRIELWKVLSNKISKKEYLNNTFKYLKLLLFSPFKFDIYKYYAYIIKVLFL